MVLTTITCLLDLQSIIHLFFARNLQRNPQQLLSEVKENSPLAGIDFTTAFQDEDKVIEGINGGFVRAHIASSASC